MYFKRLFLLTVFSFALTACDTTTDNGTNVLLQGVTIKDLAPLNPGSNNGQPTPPTKFTLFSLKDQTQVANADSNSTKWDLGFRGTTVILNGGTSGPGTAQGQVITGDFDTLVQAPLTGYIADAKPNYAIPLGSDKGWYNYNPATMLIAPIPGKILLVKTTGGNYAKIQILSYYKGAPVSPNATTDASRYYTFRYVYQSDGTPTFPKN